jgi:hypothetical protein
MYKKEMFILSHSFEGLNPWLVGPLPNSMVEAFGGTKLFTS